MPVDTSIYARIQTPKIDTPSEREAKRLALDNARLQNEEARRRFTLEDDMSAALAESGGDLTKASQALAQRGRGQAALALQDKAASQRKAEIENKLKLWEAVGSDAMMLDQTWRQALQAAGNNQQAAIAQIMPVYANVRRRWAQMGHELPEQFDPMQNFAGIGMAKENIQYLKSLAPDIQLADTGGALTPVNKNPLAGQVGPVPGAQPIPKTAAPAAPTELKRLQDERAALPANDPRRAEHERAIAGYKAGKGTEVTVNTGPMTPGKAAAGKVDEDLLGVTRNLMQLDSIAGQFRPEYQRYLDRATFSALAMKDKAGLPLTNKERKDLTDFASYRRNAVNAMNEYIKSITGAAMSEPEAQRILAGMPKVGDGIFDGDSPTEFKAKMDDAMKQTRLAVARLAYIKRRGMSLTDEAGNAVVALESMPALMKQRAQEIERDLRASSPKVSDAEIGKARRRQLALEFGLVE